MSLSPYLQSLRAMVGSTRLLLPAITAAVFDDAGALLLVLDHGSDVWTTPGGMIEPDETPADALVRETWEETGLLVHPERVLGVFGGPDVLVRYPNGDEAQYVMTVFECSVLEGTPRADGVETTDVRYWRASDAAGLSLAPWLTPVLGTLYARPTVPWFAAPRWRPGA